MALLHEFHGPLTVAQLQAAAVKPGWRCLEVGAGTGTMTSWLAERVAPTGRVLALDLEIHWLDALQSEIVEVRQADITRTELPPHSFDLVLAQMLLLHLPDPGKTCRQLLHATAPGGQLIIHDADFTPVALEDGTWFSLSTSISPAPPRDPSCAESSHPSGEDSYVKRWVVTR